MREHLQYELFEEIGRGSRTVVYRARKVNTSQEVAVKELSDEARQDPEQVQRFGQAANFFANLPSYERIARVYDYIAENDWLIAELMEGSLADELARSPGGLSADQVRSLLRQALQALTTLHAAGRLYGSLKPSNLLIDNAGRVKLADSPGLMSDGVMRAPEGSRKYLAPEQINSDFGEVGPGTDLYVLGFTALELLVGVEFDKRFRGTSADAVDPLLAWERLHGSATEAIPSAGEMVPGLPEDLTRVIDRLLQKNVSARYETAAAALGDLAASQNVRPSVKLKRPPAAPADQRIKTGEPARTQPPEPMPKKDSRKKAILVASAVVAVLVLGVAALTFMTSGDSPAQTAEITIRTVPEGATVTFLDPAKPDKPPSAKKTTSSYHVHPQKGRVRLAHDGYITEEQEIDPEAKKEYEFRLKPVSQQGPAGSVKDDTGALAARLFEQGKKLLATGKDSEALAAFNRAIELKKDHALAHAYRGLVVAGQGHLDDGLKDCNEAIRLDDEQSDSYALRAELLADKGEFERAGADAAMAIGLDPESPRAYRSRGYVALRRGDWPKAVPDYDKAIAILPAKDQQYLEERAFLHAKQQDYTRAIADYTALLELAPQNKKWRRIRAEAYNARGVDRFREKDFGEALNDFRAALADNKRATFYKNAGNAHLQRNEIDDALKDLSRAIELSEPPDPEALELRARVHDRLGEEGKAQEDRRKAQRLRDGKGSAD